MDFNTFLGPSVVREAIVLVDHLELVSSRSAMLKHSGISNLHVSWGLIDDELSAFNHGVVNDNCLMASCPAG